MVPEVAKKRHKVDPVTKIVAIKDTRNTSKGAPTLSRVNNKDAENAPSMSGTLSQLF